MSRSIPPSGNRAATAARGPRPADRPSSGPVPPPSAADWKETQDAIEKSEARYRLLAENILDVVWLLDLRSLSFLYVSPSVRTLRGYSPEEVIGTPLEPTLTPESFLNVQGWISQEMESILQTGAASNNRPAYQVEMRRKDGSTVWTEVVADFIKDGNGEPIQILGVTRDISVRKSQEEQLVKLNRLYQTLIEVNEVIVRGNDREALFEEVCRILTETGGFRLAWLGLKSGDGSVRVAAAAGPARDYTDGISVRWDDTPEGRGPTGTSIREGRTVIYPDFAAQESFAPWRAKTLAHDLRSSGAFALREKGEVIGALMVYVREAGFIGPEEQELVETLIRNLELALQSLAEEDLRRKTDQALKESEERYRSALENLDEIIYVSDPDGFISFVSPGVRGILGYAPDEVIGRSVFELVHPDEVEAVAERRARLLAGHPTTAELRILARDGSVRWVSSTTQPLRKGEAVVGYQGVIRDVTAAKQAEAELEQHRRNLEKLVLDRTAALSDARAAALSLMQDSERQRAEIERTLAESRRMEAALRESEDSLRRILRTTNEGFWRIDARAVTLEVNQALCGLLGRSREEVLGRPIYDFVDADNAAVFRDELSRRANGFHGSYEITLGRPDGSSVICHLSATPLYDAHDMYDGSFAMVTDITQRKRAEEELRRRTEELEAFNKAMVDREIKIIEVKEEVNRLCRELGRPPAYPPVWERVPGEEPKP